MTPPAGVARIHCRFSQEPTIASCFLTPKTPVVPELIRYRFPSPLRRPAGSQSPLTKAAGHIGETPKLTVAHPRQRRGLTDGCLLDHTDESQKALRVESGG